MNYKLDIVLKNVPTTDGDQAHMYFVAIYKQYKFIPRFLILK